MISLKGRELLRLLTTKVRVATENQLKDLDAGWSRHQRTSLVRGGMLRERQLSLAVPPVRHPLATWQLGDPRPDFGAIAWRGRKRLRSSRVQRVRVYWATEKAVNLVGGVGGKLRQPWQLQHDLGVTAAYLRMLRESSQDAANWISEDLYRRLFGQRRGEKIADGFVTDTEGRVERVVEFVGDYSASHLRAFHEYWSRRRMAYEFR